MPQEDATPNQLSIYDRLYTAAPTVSNAEIETIWKLERSTASSPPLQAGYHYFCMRSIAMTGKQLDEVVEYMRVTEEGYEETYHWRQLLDLYHNPGPGGTEVFTIRYFGTVEGPRRPVDRQTEDLLNTKLSAIMGEFYRAVEAVDSSILDQAEVHLIVDSTQDPSSELFAQDTERLLIQCAHPRSLLNRQLGGYYSSYLPNADDAANFADLKTDAWYRFGAHSTRASNELLSLLSTHFDSVQQYAIDYPAESGTAVHEFTDRRRRLCEKQATPRQYHGITLLTFLGKDVTYADYLAEETFWGGGSRAGVLTTDMLQRIVDTEADSHGRGGYQQILRPQGSFWCFADLWPWLWHQNAEQAMYFLRSYLATTRPLIVVSYSRAVNTVTRGNFLHKNGASTIAFTSMVGDLTIQYYSDPTVTAKIVQTVPTSTYHTSTPAVTNMASRMSV